MEKTLNVSGMHCKSCELLLVDALMEIKGVKKILADNKKGTVKVEYDDESVLPSVKSAIKELGYLVSK
ncbi:MAG: heavy metal-associated domain-containing protein [Candidatus Micrarchaeota archaeon]